MAELPQFNVNSVSLGVIAAMKLIRLANESSELQIGYLQGLVNEETVELTNCYPIPQFPESDPAENDKQVMQYSKKHNLDNNKAGIYLIGNKLDQFQLENFDLQHKLQSVARYAIFLVYSPQLSAQGHPKPFFAYQINSRYLDAVLRGEEITQSEFQKWNTRFDKIYRDVPIELKKSPFEELFLYQFRDNLKAKYQKVSLANNFDYNKAQLIESIEEQLVQSEKINADALNKKPPSQDAEKIITINELVEYFLTITKVRFLTDQIKREAVNVIESEVTVHNLSQP